MHMCLSCLKLYMSSANEVLFAAAHLPDTALQIDREVSFAITMTFIIENVTLDFIKNNEKS